jgi:demethylmenaquinone methyltransferase / 2-methoxy-6-polyprenyl-1,4-benzoquinol methylase
MHKPTRNNLPQKEQKETFVQEMFNAIAGRYDVMNSLMSFGLDKGWRKFAVRCAGLKPGGHGLDVCCGTGMLAIELARTTGPDGRITGLDFSGEMLAVAQKNIQGFECRDTIELVQGNAMKLPFADNTFDCVTVGWGLRNVPDIAIALQEMVRVVKSGGKVVSLDMGHPTAPVFKQLYWFWFEKIIPAMGKLWGGNKRAYAYLHDSARVFPHQQKLARMFAQAGLVDTTYHNLAGGVVAVVEGRKAPGGDAGKLRNNH